MDHLNNIYIRTFLIFLFLVFLVIFVLGVGPNAIDSGPGGFTAFVFIFLGLLLALGNCMYYVVTYQPTEGD